MCHILVVVSFTETTGSVTTWVSARLTFFQDSNRTMLFTESKAQNQEPPSLLCISHFSSCHSYETVMGNSLNEPWWIPRFSQPVCMEWRIRNLQKKVKRKNSNLNVAYCPDLMSKNITVINYKRNKTLHTKKLLRLPSRILLVWLMIQKSKNITSILGQTSTLSATAWISSTKPTTAGIPVSRSTFDVNLGWTTSIEPWSGSASLWEVTSVFV